MTAFIATVTDTCGWLTQDRGLYDGRDGSLLEEVDKVNVLPEVGMLVGGAGFFRGMHMWPRFLADHAMGEVVGLADIVPEHLRELAQRGDLGEEPAQIVHVGYSPSEDRVVGFVFERENDFEPQRFTGTLFMPEPSPEAPGYRTVARRWNMAQRGNGVEKLHETLLSTQLWSMEANQYRDLKGVSRGYTMGVVDAQGPRIVHEGQVARMVDSSQPGGLIA